MNSRALNPASTNTTTPGRFFQNNRENTFFNSKNTFFNQTVTPIVQTKPQTNQPGGRCEKETRPETNLRGPANVWAQIIQKKFISGIYRKCNECEGNEKVQRKPASDVGGGTISIPGQIAKLSGKGSPLPSETLAEMNSSIGADFSRVRIHSDRQSAGMSNELNAQAFTTGNDIYFNTGKYDASSHAGKHLLAHELTHTIQQQKFQQHIQREPMDNTPIENCLKQGSELLPGKVGMVEHINREVALDEILGRERKHFEDQIRMDHNAREFVCQAGVGAMMALFYNRDYRNRLRLEVARQSFNEHPEYYSIHGFDATKKSKELLKKKYNIFIEPGDKEWSPDDIVLLTQALTKLTDNEIPLIGNYHFIRWTNRCNQLEAQNPEHECSLDDYAVCGLHEPEIIRRKYTITMYDCMRGATDQKIAQASDLSPGADTIVHEIGHAMEYGRLRLAVEEATDAKKEYERIKRQLDDAKTADARTSIEQKLKAAEIVKNDTDKKMKAVLSSPVLHQFTKLTKGKRALTPYSTKNAMEAFAEAFMIYKVAPKILRDANKPLFNWFEKGGFIKTR